MASFHSHVAVAAYIDLVTILLDEEISDIRGAPFRKKISDRHYWYDRYRVGDAVIQKYLGEDNDEMRARVERHAELQDRREGRLAERRRLVRLLRSERFLGADRSAGGLLTALARTGLFRLGGVLVGTNAFRLYEGELGVRFSVDQIVHTGDFDIASFERLSLAIADHVEPSLDGVLKDFDLEPVPGLRPEAVWRWQQRRDAAFLEFLTPSFTEDEGIRPLAALGVHAQALHHLNYLIAEPVHAALIYRDGVLVRIPRPERFAVHKLIVADRRQAGPDSLKARKDLMQAAFLAEVLSDERPGDLEDAMADAAGRGPKWRQRIEASLMRLTPEQRACFPQP